MDEVVDAAAPDDALGPIEVLTQAAVERAAETPAAVREDATVKTPVASCTGHWSMAAAQSAFKTLFRDCEDVWHFGQFVWYQMLSLGDHRDPRPPLNELDFYNKCMDLFSRDQLDKIRPWIDANGVFRDQVYLDNLFEISRRACYDYVGHIARSLQRRGGIKGCHGLAPFLSFGAIYSGSQTFPSETAPAAPWFQIVRYDKDALPGYVNAMKRCLDAGYVIRAGVCSGASAPDLSHPDHYVLIIGYDDDRFVFWDPDALVSNRMPFGPTFGTLTYYHPSDPSQNKFHRLGTARSDAELQCGNSQGTFTLETPSSISHDYRGRNFDTVVPYVGNFRIMSKRYQITSLEKL